MSKLALLLTEHMDLYGSLLLLLVPNHKSTKTSFATFILCWIWDQSVSQMYYINLGRRLVPNKHIFP